MKMGLGRKIAMVQMSKWYQIRAGAAKVLYQLRVNDEYAVCLSMLLCTVNVENNSFERNNLNKKGL